MKRSKVTIVLLSLLVLALAVSACATGATTGVAKDQEIIYNMGAEPPQLNTPLTTDAVSFTILNHVMEGLTRRNDQDVAVAGMAETWDISDDGLTYTFHLRDAVWSNGEPVTAADFEFAFRTLLDPATAAPYSYFAYTIKNAAAYNAGEAEAADLGIRVIDEKTLEITLEQICPYFLDTLAIGFMMPINEAFYNEVGADNYGMEADTLIYNGPYEISAWEHSVSLTMQKRDGYWNEDAIKLTKITGRVITDAQAAYTEFLSGNLNMVNLVDTAMIQDAEDNDVEPISYSDGSTIFLEFNLTNEALANIHIRTALTLALDRQSFVDKILNNHSLPALSFTPPAIRNSDGTGSFNDSVGDLISDNERQLAQQELDLGLTELGVDSLTLSMLIEDSDTATLYANAIAQYLNDSLGITLEVEPMPFMSLLERVFSLDYDIAYLSWGPDYNDPMTFLDIFESTSGNNLGGYASADYDALLSQARQTIDDAARFDAYAGMEEILMEDLPIAPLYFGARSYAVSDSLKGVHRSAFQDICFLYAQLDA